MPMQALRRQASLTQMGKMKSLFFDLENYDSSVVKECNNAVTHQFSINLRAIWYPHHPFNTN
jgi:hypothetical protein